MRTVLADRFSVSRIAAAVAGAFVAGAASQASADTFDVNRMIVERLQANGHLNMIYHANKGANMPGGMTTTATFTGEVGGKGITFGRVALVERPNILVNRRVANCNDSPTRSTVSVDTATTEGMALTNTDSLETGRETKVNVSFKNPLGLTGVTAGAEQTWSQTITASRQSENQKSKTVTWKDEHEITIEPRKVVTVQYVVTENTVQNVPFTANLVLTGATDLNFAGGPPGFQWVGFAGTQLPANAIRLGTDKGAVPAVCRFPAADGFYLGKIHGTRCYFNATGGTNGSRRSQWRDSGYEVLVGDRAAVRLGNQYTTDPFDADGKGYRKLCLVHWGGDRIPGFVQGGVCMIETNAQEWVGSTYDVVRTPVPTGTTVTIRLDQYLTEAQRTFDLRGFFSGTTAVEGDFRVGAPGQATCGLVTAATTPATAPQGDTRQAARTSIAQATMVAPAAEPALPKAAVAKKSKPPLKN